jgi:phospholipase/carboxylesterase
MGSEHPETLEIDGRIFNQILPSGTGPHPIMLMLHGWTGDENAMWIFAPRLPKNALVLAPRGFYETPWGGYSWHEQRSSEWPITDDFKPAIESLLEILTPDNFPFADFSKLNLIGFSQGAALAYTFGLHYPSKVESAAGLSGFLPDDASNLIENHPLQGKKIFIAHGTQDELVPVELARQSVRELSEAGAEVTYCEDDVGHKLSANCFQGLQRFFEAE